MKHGIAGLLEGGTIRLAAQRVETGIAMTIENELDEDAPAKRSMGVGHDHVRRRLAVRYGGAAQFDARAENGVYRVVLRLPCESPIASSSLA